MSSSAQQSKAKASTATAERRPRRAITPAPESSSKLDALHVLQSRGGNHAFSNLLGGGRPLSPEVRADMEARFGADFATVRIHDGRDAHSSAALMDAKAFTHGENIAFNKGRFAPQSHEGKRLLAHELAHVIQQRRGGGAPIIDAGAQHELGADAAADAVAANASSVAVNGGTSVGVARDEDDDSWTARLRRKARAVRDMVPEKYREPLSKAADFVADKAVSTVMPPMLGDGLGSKLLHAGEKAVTGEGDAIEDLKAIPRVQAQETIGAAKGIATQVTEVVDTGLWLGKEYKDARDKAAKALGGKEGSIGNEAVKRTIDSLAYLLPGTQALPVAADAGDLAKSVGLVDPETGDASLTAPLSEKMNEGVKWAEKTIGGTPDDPEMFTPAEKAELTTSIGVQVALAFTGAEEVKIAMNVIGALGGLRGVVESIRRDPNWATSARFWSSIIAMVLSIVGLKHSLAASKITTLVLKFGWVAAAVPPLSKMAADYMNTEISDEERQRRMKEDWIQVIHVLKDAILHVVQSQGGKSAAPDESNPPPKNNTGVKDNSGAPPSKAMTGDESNVTPIEKGKAAPKSTASQQLDANLEKLPEGKKGSVSPLRKSSGPPNEVASKEVPIIEEVPQKLAVGQTHGPEIGTQKSALSGVNGNEPTTAALKGGKSKAKVSVSTTTTKSSGGTKTKTSGGGGKVPSSQGKATKTPSSKATLAPVNKGGGRGTNKEPLVAARVRGGGSAKKGTYWVEGSPEFAAAATNSKNFVVLPKSEADALGFRPSGKPYQPKFNPYKKNGVQVESNGAGSGKGNKHNVTGRAEVQPDEAAAKQTFDKTIGATRNEAHGYKHLIDNGELGIMRPGNVSTGGVDAITAKIEGGKAKIFLNDFTGPQTTKGAKPTHQKWVGELDGLLAEKNFGFGNAATNKAIRDARANGEVYVRTVRITTGKNGTTVTVETAVKVKIK